MNRKERQEARADRYRELAKNAEQQSTAAYNRSHEIVGCIPMGQLLIRETSFQRIMRKTGRKPVQCKCQLCKMQCHTPCLGTPEDIEKIIDAGYSDKLAATYWAAGMMMGVIEFPIPMIQAVTGEEYCAFFQNGLCELHDKGLKPIEGRLSHHSIGLDNFKPSKSIAWNVAREWLMEENVATIDRVIDKFTNERGL